MNEQTKRDLERISGAAREDALKIIFDNWKLTAEKMTEKALEGSVPHAKFLADWAGFTGAEPTVAEPKPAKKEESKKDSEKKEEEEGPCLVQILIDTIADVRRSMGLETDLSEDEIN